MLLVSLILILFSNLRRNVDSEIETLIIKARGELHPDTNIVLIHFSEEDISRIGPWPIKRSYYALLINQLSKLGVKKIGLEVFLSSRFVTQSVYDHLLEKEIVGSGKVILSSVAGRISERNSIYFTDSLSYPSPRLLNESLSTGHINFFKNFDFEIPIVLINNAIRERAFSLQLSDLPYEKELLSINFIASWKKFRNYSALEFTELIYNQSNELGIFKDKIAIIGVSDNQIAPTFKTPFDEQLPGLALHALAVDNIYSSRDLNYNFYTLSIILFPFFILGFVFYRNLSEEKHVLKFLFFGITYITTIFIFTSLFYFKISSSLFLFPFISLIITDIIIYLLKGREKLKGAIDEAAILKNLLLSKENELGILQKKLSESGEASVQLVENIDSLKSDIKKLKENEDDRSGAQLNIESGVKEFHGIIYTSNLMAQVIELVKKAAPTDSTILIEGESGTGKELVAKAIHSLSKKQNKNFIAVNCGALTDSLLESELFGYVRGAFTGAITDKKGRFELADEGTIFLDEIGDTSENFQVKVLRVLQSGEIEKVGSTKTEIVNVRVVAATNKNLTELVKEKKFREDLYYRLNVIKIELPPLRERKEEINALAQSFIQSEIGDMQISIAALQALNDNQWKGNVRELESVIKRAVIFARSEKRNMIRLSDLPKEIVKEAKYGFEDLVIESLREKSFSHSSMVETAKELGNVNRTMISEHLRGLVLKTLVENNFNIEKTVYIISGTQDSEINERVLSKIQTFISNIETDLKKTNERDFEILKKKFASKYKNLPVKFHSFLDEVIKWKIRQVE